MQYTIGHFSPISDRLSMCENDEEQQKSRESADCGLYHPVEVVSLSVTASFFVKEPTMKYSKVQLTVVLLIENTDSMLGKYATSALHLQYFVSLLPGSFISDPLGPEGSTIII